MSKFMDSGDFKVLIVDDEESLRSGLQTYLELDGLSVDTASSAEDALSLDLKKYDLLLLDIMMGGISGLDLARRIKSNPQTEHIPIIFLTARGADDDMVDGLNLGADDYITKPYSPKNVSARIAAVLRRTQHRRKCGVVCNRASLMCTVDGKPLKLPKKEFELLALLIENPGRIFTRDEIMSRIWPEQTFVVDRSVDVHITRLRGKISPYGSKIVTRSGYGYGWLE